MKPPKVLLADFNPHTQRGSELSSRLQETSDLVIEVHHRRLSGLEVQQATEEISTALAMIEPEVLILILSEEGQASATTLFHSTVDRHSSPPIVVVPSTDSPRAITELYELGCSDYFLPPFRTAEVLPRVRRLIDFRRARLADYANLKEAWGLEQLVGKSAVFLEEISKIPRLARCDACVLITGETGTGKEVCARSMHYLSPRARQPFVPLNCGAVPVDLLENELFGHAAGAFTSAQAAHSGVIHEARHGTLFLDEIDALPLAAQVKLLRFLQDKEYRPLGSSKVCKGDVRIIAASNVNLEELLRERKFRRDLFYRINVLPLHLPALRQRKEDIPLLARHFLTKYGIECNCVASEFTPAALHKLCVYDWPGNVRELENVIERVAVLCSSNLIEGKEINLPIDEPNPALESFNALKAKVIADFERSYIRAVLEQHKGNIAHAARAAKKNRRAFFELMRKHHIRAEHPTGPSHELDMDNARIKVDKNIHPTFWL